VAPYRNLDIPAYWTAEIARFGQTWDHFRDRRVLDVGCGPFGMIHYADQAAARVCIDPLLPHYRQEFSSGTLCGPQLSVCAMGEALPLADQSIDIVICHNAIDHMLDPTEALGEMARVLRPGGTALLMIHTFPSWLRPLYPLDRMHPHHFSAESFALFVQARFRIGRCETVRRRFDAPSGRWWRPSFWKYAAANLVVSGTYVFAESVAHDFGAHISKPTPLSR
jgi:ubiquinone/menaquinone biosynthesis C-methylase UbiE